MENHLPIQWILELFNHTGNFIDFGNLQSSRRESMTAASPTRGIIACGQDPSSGNQGVNIIEFVTNATTGNTRFW